MHLSTTHSILAKAIHRCTGGRTVVALGPVFCTLLFFPIACHSPSEPAGCSSIGGSAHMSILACGAPERSVGVQIIQSGCSFDMIVPTVGTLHGTIENSVAVFTVRFDSPCQGNASGTFEIHPNTFKTFNASGSWSGTISGSDSGCACPVGPTSATFTISV